MCSASGSSAAAVAVAAPRNRRCGPIAMSSSFVRGDAFSDKIDGCHDQLERALGDKLFAEKVVVPAERRFTGFDAYKHVIDAVDVVLLCTPPGFRPTTSCT